MDAISCLAPPPATSSADAAIARALHFSSTTATTMSLSPDSSASSSSSSSSLSLSHYHQSPLLISSALADLPSSCPYYDASPQVPPPHAVAATCCDSVLFLVADSPPRRRSSPQHHHNHALALAPAGARAGKRRSRASKRAPTTYISTDPANFRLMVQQITGVQQADLLPGGGDVAGVEMAMLQRQVQQATALFGSTAATGNGHPQLLPAGDDASALRQHQLQLELQQQPCFPTLDSWNVVMYETNSADML